jgi:hypothetical protein
MPLIFQTCAAGFGTIPSEGKSKKSKGKVGHRKRATFTFSFLPFAFLPVVAEASSGRSLRLSG